MAAQMITRDSVVYMQSFDYVHIMECCYVSYTSFGTALVHLSNRQVIAGVVMRALEECEGDVLVFTPGVGFIRS
jgi:hypothetical protein